MYEFLTGPMLWAAFLIFVIGLARRVVLYIRGLDWRLERVAYGPGRKIGMKGAGRTAGAGSRISPSPSSCSISAW